MRVLLALGVTGIVVGLTLAGSDEKLPQDKTVGKLEVVGTFRGAMPTGVTVSHKGRVFLTFPRWGDEVIANVAELKDGKAVPYPTAEINKLDPKRPTECLLTVQSAVVDPKDRLWLCDTGTVEMGPVIPGGARLMCVNLETNKIEKTIPIPVSGGAIHAHSYLNDLRFDLRRGAGGVAFITDSSEKGNGIVMVDLASGKSWPRLSDHPSTKAEKAFLPNVEGRPLYVWPTKDQTDYLKIGSDGIALSHDGKRLFYCPLAGRRLYSVSADALANPNKAEEDVARTVEDHGDRGFASDGLEHDDRGRLLLTDYEHNAIVARSDKGTYTTLAHDPRLLWPDTLSVGRDGHLYITANQLHRQSKFQAGVDQREKPYVLFRLKIDAGPVLLK